MTHDRKACFHHHDEYTAEMSGIFHVTLSAGGFQGVWNDSPRQNVGFTARAVATTEGHGSGVCQEGEASTAAKRCACAAVGTPAAKGIQLPMMATGKGRPEEGRMRF
jgi:hypothetical protein